jgi:membrane protease YdiL (CAAX protease family)
MVLENSLTNNQPQPRSKAAFWMPVLRVVLMLAVNIGLLLAMALPVRQYFQPLGPLTPWFAWTAGIGFNLIIILQALAHTCWVDRRPLSDFPLRFDRKARTTALWGAILSVALLAVYVGLTQAAGVVSWRWNTGFLPLTTFLAALLTAMAGPGEEFLFRGYLMRTLGTYGPRASALLSSIIFALAHMLTGRVNPLDQFALFLHGYLFARLAQRTKSLWPGIVIHFVYNALTSLVWAGNGDATLFAFDGSLGWTKWAFKAAMVIPFFVLIHLIYGREKAEA